MKTSDSNARARSGRQQLNGNDAKGVLDSHYLPDDHFESLWESIIIPEAQRSQMLAQAVLNFTLRPGIDPAKVPMHGIILLAGPPGTGKTSIARGLASRTAATLSKLGKFGYVEVEPHAMASSSHGKTQKAVQELLGQTISELAVEHPLIVLLDEVETLAANRSRMSLEANPVDVHRATDAVLAQLDHLAAEHENLLFLATTNFAEAIDEAFVSRADLVMEIGLPNAAARAMILEDTLIALGDAAPTLKSLATKVDWNAMAELTDGLDGRRLRKAVVSSLTRDKRTTVDPNLLTSEAITEALKSAAQAVHKRGKR